ncbi:MAG: LamG domain-containing protein [Prevotellaceae bacterium]|jgi:hypothetical protein|nr:LamG domain-containing protein [Prevotellaceae bacterium]
MKKIHVIILLFASALFFATSCFQDLGQDPAFDYPDGYDGLENLGTRGEISYMPFETDAFVETISEVDATKAGTPTIAAGKVGQAYQGAADAYLSFKLADFATPVSGSKRISASFWYKRGAAERAGIISCGIATSNQKIGFVLFREGNTNFQLLAGNGTTGTWGGAVALTEATTTDWVHLAFSIDETAMKLYCNGVLKKETPFAGPISWTGCTAISIGSGEPTFGGWNHKGEDGQIDELRFFNKTLSDAEINDLYTNP